jgi:hypothetical protein
MLFSSSNFFKYPHLSYLLFKRFILDATDLGKSVGYILNSQNTYISHYALVVGLF